LYEVVVVALRINDSRYGLPRDLQGWPLAIVVALLLSVSVRAPLGLDLLGRRGRWLLAVAATVVALTAIAVPPLAGPHRCCRDPARPPRWSSERMPSSALACW
jgi:hypothetical protein